MRTIGLGLLIAAATAAQAQEQSSIDRCRQMRSTLEIVDCLGRVGQEADKHLNAAYQKALKGIEPEGVPALRAAERAWLEYRKQRCAYVSAGEGTIRQVLAADCMAVMTKARADELDSDAQGLAGPG
jgi:uncharacterized protein YecT (DUF1311 family)